MCVYAYVCNDVSAYVWMHVYTPLCMYMYMYMYMHMWVVVKTRVPLWVPIMIRHLLFRVPKMGP